MQSVVVSKRLAPAEVSTVRGLVEDTERIDGYRPLSDQSWSDLVHGTDDAFVAAMVIEQHDGQLVAYAQAVGHANAWTLELVIRPSARVLLGSVARQALAAVIEAIRAAGGGELSWLIQDPSPIHDSLADEFGLVPKRRLQQMRRSLPTNIAFDLQTRPFDPARDIDEWVLVNSRAFAWNPEQGGWTAANVRARMVEPWFDADGFLIHERDGRMAGFCWTKVHADSTPAIGEIYIIAVDPDFHGLGLGRDLTLAGLASLAERDIQLGMLFVDADNVAAVRLYDTMGFVVHRTDCLYQGAILSAHSTPTDELPRWSVADVHESFTARTFLAAMDRAGADTDRLEALFDEYAIRAIDSRPVTAGDGAAAEAIIQGYNAWERQVNELVAYVYATVATNSFDEPAQALASELANLESRGRPLLTRLADWVAALGPAQLATVSAEARDHIGPLLHLAERSKHQMSEVAEGLYAELGASSSDAWYRLHGDVTSQLHAEVNWPHEQARRLPMSAVRGLASHADPDVRRAAYEAELAAWPTIAVVCAAAINGVKGSANVVNRRRDWASPLDASLYANSVGRPAFDAMQAAVQSSLADFRSWMNTKAGLHGYQGPLRWSDLVAPLPIAPAEISWERGLEIVQTAFDSYGGPLAGLPERAIAEQWIDAEPRGAKRGGAFCMPFVNDRSLVFLNWNGSVDSAQTTAHELGHAYHNTQLAHRTPLQRRLPMALAETASIFCETLIVEEGLQRLEGHERLGLLDVDLQGSAQVVVDIHSRFLFETELFARRQRRTLGVTELNEMMLAAQGTAYGAGLDQSTAHPYMWAVKSHYYGSHFYNWPYTYGLLFGLGLFARYRADPDHFRHRYDDVLSRVGMNTAEELGAAFDLDVTDEAFWIASIDILRGRMAEYSRLAAELAP